MLKPAAELSDRIGTVIDKLSVVSDATARAGMRAASPSAIRSYLKRTVASATD